MRSWGIDEEGRVVERAEPREPAGRGVLVRVEAVALGPLEGAAAAGAPPDVGAGADGAGIVVQGVGEGPAEGDAVVFPAVPAREPGTGFEPHSSDARDFVGPGLERPRGCWASLCRIPADRLLPRPPGWTAAEAAAWLNLPRVHASLDALGLRRGSLIAVFDAGRDDGPALCQAASARGLRVVAISPTVDLLEQAWIRCCEEILVEPNENVAGRLRKLSAKRGVDAFVGPADPLLRWLDGERWWAAGVPGLLSAPVNAEAQGLGLGRLLQLGVGLRGLWTPSFDRSLRVFEEARRTGLPSGLGESLGIDEGRRIRRRLDDPARQGRLVLTIPGD